MRKTRKTRKTVMFMVLAALVVASGEARAQTSPNEARTFLDINGGLQGLSPALDAGGTFLLFGESGSVRTNQNLGAGLLGDVRLGHRIGQRLGLACRVFVAHIGQPADQEQRRQTRQHMRADEGEHHGAHPLLRQGRQQRNLQAQREHQPTVGDAVAPESGEGPIKGIDEQYQ